MNIDKILKSDKWSSGKYQVYRHNDNKYILLNLDQGDDKLLSKSQALRIINTLGLVNVERLGMYRHPDAVRSELKKYEKDIETLTYRVEVLKEAIAENKIALRIQPDRPTVEEMLNLIRRLPNSSVHILGNHVTSEFISGWFGRSFEADTLEESVNLLIDYFYEHIGHDSIIGREITESGFPNLDKMYEYCKPKEE